MVASRQADVASVDSNVLGYALAKNPALVKDIHVFTSIGPLPPYPINMIFNKFQITALFRISPEWKNEKR